MGTKTKTTTDQQNTNQYDQASMGAYHGALKSANNIMANPFNNAFYNQNVGLLTANAQAQNQNQMQNLTSNLQRSGIGTGSAAGNMIRSLGGYMASRNQANAFTSANQMAQGDYWNAMSYVRNPLQTGSSSHGTQVQQTGGLGTWLPQVAGMALGGISGAMGGGGLMGGLRGAMGMSPAGGGNAMGGFMGSVGGIANSALNSPQYMPGSGPSPMAAPYSPFGGGGYASPMPNLF